MKRRLFNFVALACAVLALAVSTLWVRSYFAEDIVFLEDRWQGPQIDQQLKSRLVVYEQQGLSRTRQYFWRDTRYELHVSRGRVATATFRDWCEPGRIARGKPLEYVLTHRRLGHESAASQDLPTVLNIGGFTATGGPDRQMSRAGQPSYPLWPALLLALPLPLLWLKGAWCRLQRLKHGRCPACGYDLRATPDRCPECGGPRESLIR